MVVFCLHTSIKMNRLRICDLALLPHCFLTKEYGVQLGEFAARLM